MLQKVGFFHFGARHDDPKTALERALEDAQKGKDQPSGVDSDPDALIVLPEAFNIAVPYRGEGERNFERTILVDLRHVAKRFNVLFVAGLVIRERCGPRIPYSAAYLIDGTTCPILMCYKFVPDGTEAGNKERPENYTVWSTETPDFKNPILYQGVNIGALICADAAAPKMGPNQSYWDRLLTVVKASDVICVPAHMDKNILGDGKVGSSAALTSVWKNKLLILANSRPNAINSFITDGAGIIREPAICDPENKVITLPLTSLTVGR